jgi:hypothetical protein
LTGPDWLLLLPKWLVPTVSLTLPATTSLFSIELQLAHSSYLILPITAPELLYDFYSSSRSHSHSHSHSHSQLVDCVCVLACLLMVVVGYLVVSCVCLYLCSCLVATLRADRTVKSTQYSSNTVLHRTVQYCIGLVVFGSICIIDAVNSNRLKDIDSLYDTQYTVMYCVVLHSTVRAVDCYP